MRLSVVISGLLMVAASLAAWALKPTVHLTRQDANVDLERIVPRQFADWTIDTTIAPVSVAPDVKAKLDVLYNQTLMRTYVNNQGQRMMVVVAYGGDQSDGLAVHKPEICYSAQGFEILFNKTGSLDTGQGLLPVKRLVAKQGARDEPITYWMTVGDVPVVGALQQKLAQVRHGLTGRVPDGLLFRVSSIDRDAEAAFGRQEAFIQALLAATEPEARVRVAGRPGA